MSLRVLLLVQPGEARDAYLKVIETLDVECDTVSSFKEMHGALPRNVYNGLLLDVPTAIRADRNERALVHDLIEMFPYVRLRWDAQSSEIRLLLYGTAQSQVQSIEDFIEKECRRFPGRKLRECARIERQYNVTVSGSADFTEGRTWRTVTLNVSRGGCFILSSADLDDVQHLWVRFHELGDDTPLKCEIRWRQKWGVSPRFPGFGLKFLDLSTTQRNELCTMVGLTPEDLD